MPGPTPFSASASANSGLRTSGRIGAHPSVAWPDCLHGRTRTRCDSAAGQFALEAGAHMDEVLRALKYRAWHRGTREADMMIGGFFDAKHESWDAHDRALFAALLMEQDVDIMAW